MPFLVCKKLFVMFWVSICHFEQGSPGNLPKMDGKVLKILTTPLKGHIFGTKGISGYILTPKKFRYSDMNN